MSKQLTTIRLSDAARNNLNTLRAATGIESQTALIETALAALAAGLTKQSQEQPQMISYLQTNDDNKLIRVPSRESESEPLEIVDRAALRFVPQFNMVNTLKSTTMREARAVAKDAGLRLADPGHIAIAHIR